jgi:predicted NBD/HSP70 family sugar kinase
VAVRDTLRESWERAPCGLRFLDKEPEEVFEAAANPQYHAFFMLWHRALAAACATCIHLDGPGEFFIVGRNSRFVNTRLLTEHVDSMVAMSALQGSTFSVAPEAEEIGVLGAAINAELALTETHRMQLA